MASLRSTRAAARCVGIATLVASSLAVSDAKAELFVSDFESGSIQGQNTGKNDAWGQQGCHPWSINVVEEGEMGAPSPRAGEFMVRFELGPDDPLCFDRPRAELNGFHGSLNEGEENWVGFSYYVEAPVQDADVHTVAQFHWGGGGTPPMIQNNMGFVRYRPGAGQVPKVEPGLPVVSGQWHDVVLHVRWSREADGFATMWHDGDVVYDEQGSTLGCYPNGGCYESTGSVKIGLYSGAEFNFDERVVLYVDEYRLGAVSAGYDDGYEGVDPAQHDDDGGEGSSTGAGTGPSSTGGESGGDTTAASASTADASADAGGDSATFTTSGTSAGPQGSTSAADGSGDSAGATNTGESGGCSTARGDAGRGASLLLLLGVGGLWRRRSVFAHRRPRRG